MPRQRKHSGVETFELDETDLRSDEQRFSLVIYHRDGSKLVTLQRSQAIVVGRTTPADVPVPDRCLSREHARFWRDGSTVMVEDLGSTNGTWVNETRIQRAVITPQDRVRLGVVTVSLHVTQGTAPAIAGLLGYDEFLRQLETDIGRARTLKRRGGLLMIRGTSAPEGAIGHWHPAVARTVRPIDRLAAYGPREGLIWLEDFDLETTRDVAKRIIAAADAPLFIGAAIFPRSATTVDELLHVCRRACRDAGPDPTVFVAEPGPSLARVERLVRSPAMVQLYRTVERVARASIPVLVCGETGTGKEVVARALHDASPRRTRPLRSINCGAIPHQLVESELFGHVQGAFTGADAAKAGLFEEADGGSLLLDEIGELSLPSQVALLRVLEEQRVRRVGAAEEIAVDVRIIAATHRNVEKMVAEGSFREDLYYRLNTMTLEIPPLRARKEEILPLAEMFLEAGNAALDGQVESIAPDAARALEAYEWPGNVRELRNAIDRAVVIAEGSEVTIEDLPKRVTEARSPAASSEEPGDLRARVRAYERNLLLEALEKCGWNLTKAAEVLDLPYRTLTSKIKSLGLERPR